jgi:hypothetical protein
MPRIPASSNDRIALQPVQGLPEGGGRPCRGESELTSAPRDAGLLMTAALLQLDTAPASDAIAFRIRTRDDQFARIRIQAWHAFVIIAVHPVAEGLTVHAADLRGNRPWRALQYHHDAEQPRTTLPSAVLAAGPRSSSAGASRRMISTGLPILRAPPCHITPGSHRISVYRIDHRAAWSRRRWLSAGRGMAAPAHETRKADTDHVGWASAHRRNPIERGADT